MTDLVHDLISHFFDETDRTEVLFYLSQIRKDSVSYERIQIAAIRCADGSLTRLAGAVDEANRDWRDLLMGTGFGHDVKAHLTWAREQLSDQR